MTDDDHTTDPPKQPDRRVLALVLAFLATGALGVAAFSSRWLYHSSTQLQYHHNERNTSSIGPVHEIGMGLRTSFICPSAGACEDFSNGELVERFRKENLVARFLLQESVDAELEAIAGTPPAGKDLIESLTREREHLNSPDNKLHDAAIMDLMATKHVYATSSTFVTFGWIALVAILVAMVSLVVSAALVLANKRLVLPVMPTTTALLGIGIALITGCVFAAMKPGPPGYVGVGVGFFVFGAGVVLGLWSSLILNKLLRPDDPDLLEDAMNPDSF